MNYYIEESGEVKMDGTGKAITSNKNKKPPMNFDRADVFYSGALLICGFLYWNFIYVIKMGLGVTSFAIILSSITLIYFKQKGVKQSKKSFLWILLIGISSIQFMIFDGILLKFFNLIFISVSFIYWVAVSTNRCIDTKLCMYTFGDLLNQSILIPFANIICEYYALKKGFSKNRHTKNVMYALIGIVVFLPFMVFVITQLSIADASFENLCDKIQDAISLANLLEYVMQFILGIPVACYLFGVIYGDVVGRNIDSLTKRKVDEMYEGISFAPEIMVYTVLILFNLIYIAFFSSQLSSLISAFENVLPSNYTYAEYARRGFFELCRVSTINIILIFLANTFIKKKAFKTAPKMLRVQCGFMSVMTIGLIITALRKMYMYIQVYGLTQHRIYASWFMMLLLFFFIIIVIRQIKVFNSSKIIIIGGIVGFMVLSYGNVDGNIAKYNIENYANGNLKRLDYEALFQLSDAAIPHIYDLYQKTEDGQKKQWLYNHIVYGDYQYGLYDSSEGNYQEYDGYEDYEGRDEIENNEYDNSFKSFNLQSSRASSIRGILQSEGYKAKSNVNIKSNPSS